MQFNLVNDQEQVAQFVWRGVAWHGVAWGSVALHGVSVRVISIEGGVPAALVVWACISPCGAFPGRVRAVLAVSGSLAYYACACACPRGFGLAQHSVWWRLCAF